MTKESVYAIETKKLRFRMARHTYFFPEKCVQIVIFYPKSTDRS